MFNDDPEWDLAILSYVHDHIIDASGGSKGFHNESLESGFYEPGIRKHYVARSK